MRYAGHSAADAVVGVAERTQDIDFARDSTERIERQRDTHAVDRSNYYPAKLVAGVGDRVVDKRAIDSRQLPGAQAPDGVVRVRGDARSIGPRCHGTVLRIVRVADRWPWRPQRLYTPLIALRYRARSCTS